MASRMAFMSSKKFRRTLMVWVVAGSGAMACMLQNVNANQDTALPSDARQFVREAIARELSAIDTDHSNWMYRLHREDEKNTQDRQVIETKEGSLAKLILFNGQPLTPEQRQSDNERMRHQVEDQQERARLHKRDKADADKARQLLKNIPDAFFFAYDGMEDGLVRIALTPNPRYDPPTREMIVYHSMKGKLWIDRSAIRLARIEGQLFEDVNFGCGLLGRLDKGGTFKVVQKDVGQGHWESVLIDLNLHGRAVIFKSIAVKQKRVFTDFHRAPQGLTLSQALEILMRTHNPAPAQ